MDFTDTQSDLLANAYLLAREGKGQVIEDWAYPDAYQLAELDWLERRVEPDGEMSLRWTRTAEMALEVNQLVESVKDRQNQRARGLATGRSRACAWSPKQWRGVAWPTHESDHAGASLKNP